MNSLIGIGVAFAAPKVMSQLRDQKVTVVHAMPGRVRLQCNRWKNEVTANNLQMVFKKIPIVKKVNSSAITGTLLIQFHVKTLTNEQFDEIVKTAVDTSVASYPEMQTELMVILKTIIKTVDGELKKQTAGKLDVASLLSVVLIINGVVGMPVNPAFSSSLLYWAYTIITKHMNGLKK